MRSLRRLLLALLMAFLLGALLACSSPAGTETPSPGKILHVEDGIEYMVEWRLADVAPERLYVSAALRNVTKQPIHIEFSDCALALHAFDALGNQVFNSLDGVDPVTGAMEACLAYLATKDLAPNESLTARREFQVVIPTYEIMGHPLLGWTRPDGTYALRVLIKIDPVAGPGNPYGRVVETPLGQVYLTSAQKPLPATRTVEGVTYHVEASPMDTPTSRVTVILTITNTTKKAAEIFVSPTCPVVFSGLMDAAVRDAAYVVAYTHWRPSLSCTTKRESIALAPGESRQFQTKADASRELGVRPPLGILPGRYYLSAWIPGGVSREGNAAMGVFAAGQVDLQL